MIIWCCKIRSKYRGEFIRITYVSTNITDYCIWGFRGI